MVCCAKQRSWLRTASPCQPPAYYAGVHPQLLAEQALSLASEQKSARSGQHREKRYRKLTIQRHGEANMRLKNKKMIFTSKLVSPDEQG
jgi:hypothetical protein